MNTNNETIENLATLATKAAALDAARETAFAEERAAEAKALRAILDAVRPGLKAICSRVEATSGSTGGRNGCNPVSEVTYHDGVYVGLVGPVGPERDRDETGNRGTYSGAEVVADSAGELHLVTWSGTWSDWRGEWNRYESTLAPISDVDACDYLDPEDVAERLGKLLRAQINGMTPQRVAQAQARASKLAAVVALLGGGK